MMNKKIVHGILILLILSVIGIVFIDDYGQRKSQPPENISCAKEGETQGATGCCEGLIPKTASEVNEATGECIDYWHLVCLKCGDGVCNNKYENYCNCPEDCKREINCTTEGQINYFGDPPCCEGLTQISNAAPMKEDCIARPDGSGYCTKCGDGMCKTPENECGCPEDCSGAKSITVTSPNGGEELEIGRMCDIIWDSGQGTSIGDKLNIYLVDESKESQCTLNGRCCSTCSNWELITTIANYGEYLWDIPGDQKTGNKFRIYVRTLSSDCFKGCVEDQSDEYFSITEKKAHPCSDTDSGKDYYKKGTVTLRDVSSNKILEEKIDYCEGFDTSGMTDIMVVEHYCENNEIKSEIYTCPDGCVNGACIKPEGCVEEGNKRIIHQECCPGLVSIKIYKGEACEGYAKSAWYCTKCGDGICKPPEDKCNCPKDCR